MICLPRHGTCYIYKFSPDGTQTIFATGLIAPTGLAFDSLGNLFVADNASGDIYEYTPDGSRSVFASGLNDPFALAFHQSGILFVPEPTVLGLLVIGVTALLIRRLPNRSFSFSRVRRVAVPPGHSRARRLSGS